MTDQTDIFKADLTDEEYLVWQSIEWRRGRGAAIKADTLAWQVRMDKRKMREIISHLILRHGKLIGSATGAQPGFYIITDPAELEGHIRSLRHRGIMCLVRASALSKQSIEEIFGQARLEMKDEQD